MREAAAPDEVSISNDHALTELRQGAPGPSSGTRTSWRSRSDFRYCPGWSFQQATSKGIARDAGSEGGRSEISVTRVAENDASAARGPQLRTQRVRVRPAFFRDPDGERREIMPARVQDQRQPVAQNGIVLAPQPLVGGEDTSFGPVAGKLDTPRPPRRAGS